MCFPLEPHIRSAWNHNGQATTVERVEALPFCAPKLPSPQHARQSITRLLGCDLIAYEQGLREVTNFTEKNGTSARPSSLFPWILVPVPNFCSFRHTYTYIHPPFNSSMSQFVDELPETDSTCIRAPVAHFFPPHRLLPRTESVRVALLPLLTAAVRNLDRVTSSLSGEAAQFRAGEFSAPLAPRLCLIPPPSASLPLFLSDC